MKYSKYNLLIPNSDDSDNYFLFNTFNGSCLNINADTARQIQNGSINGINEDVRNIFMNSGIIIPSKVYEEKIFSYMHGSEKYGSMHLAATVLLTWACNLQCIYCFQGHENRIGNMSIEEADRLIKFLTLSAKYRGSKSISIVLFGGEPLINIDVGFYILEKVKNYCNENDMLFFSSIITNGTLLNIGIVKKLQEYNCQMLQITLDGVKDVHNTRRVYANNKGSFDEIIDVLKLMNSYSEINTVIRINVDKINEKDTYKLLEYIGKNGINLTNCRVDFGIVRGETSACSGYSSNCFAENEIGDLLYDLWSFAEEQGFKFNIKPMRRAMHCGLYRDNQYTFTPNLDIYKCWEQVGEKEHLMGKLDDDGKFVNTTYAFYDWMSVDPLKNSECKECVYLPTCGGGCGVISYNQTGTYHSSGCFKVKGTVEKQVLKYVEGVMKAKEKAQNCEANCCSKEKECCEKQNCE